MSPDTSKPASAQNLIRAFGILDRLATHSDGFTLNELASETSLPQPTTHRLLSVLQDLKVVRIGDDGKWRVGRRLFELGSSYLDSVELRSEARDLMQDLTADTEETCALGVLDEDRVVYIEKVDSPHPIRMESAIGRSNPAVSSSLGRAILAFSGDDIVQQTLDAGLPHRTKKTITSTQKLRTELARCHQRGYSVDSGENESGVRAVAAPIFDHRKLPLAALSVAGPQQRIPSERLSELARVAIDTADQISVRLGYQPD